MSKKRKLERKPPDGYLGQDLFGNKVFDHCGADLILQEKLESKSSMYLPLCNIVRRLKFPNQGQNTFSVKNNPALQRVGGIPDSVVLIWFKVRASDDGEKISIVEIKLLTKGEAYPQIPPDVRTSRGLQNALSASYSGRKIRARYKRDRGQFMVADKGKIVAA